MGFSPINSDMYQILKFQELKETTLHLRTLPRPHERSYASPSREVTSQTSQRPPAVSDKSHACN